MKIHVQNHKCLTEISSDERGFIDFHTKDIRTEEVNFKLNSQLSGIQEYGILIQPARISKKI